MVKPEQEEYARKLKGNTEEHLKRLQESSELSDKY